MTSGTITTTDSGVQTCDGNGGTGDNNVGMFVVLSIPLVLV